MIAKLMAWWRAGQVRRLEATVRHHAIAYQAAKARYENALLDAKGAEDDS